MEEAQRIHAFYETLWPHRAAVLRLAAILVSDPSDADDLAQDTMVKAFTSLHQFTPGSDAKSWLMSILRNTRIDRFRSAAAAKATVSLDGLGAELSGELESDAWGHGDLPQNILAAFSDQAVIDALKRLPEEIRWTLLLVDVEGHKYSEAAEALGVPAGTIKSRAHRGRMMLRDELLPLARQQRLLRE